MSLTCVLRTAHGIVMSADRRLSVDYSDQSNPNIIRRRIITDHEQKLFSFRNFGLSFYGDFCGEPMSVTIKRFLSTLQAESDLMSIAQSLIDFVGSKSNPPVSAFFFLCGYEDTSSSRGTVLSCQVADRQIIPVDDSLIMGGDLNSIANLFVKAPLSYATYNIGNAKDYLTFVTYAAAKYQQLTNSPETISPECDLLVIPRSITE